MRPKLTAMTLALPFLIASAAIASTSDKPVFDIDRFCKPVVPQFVVGFTDQSLVEEGDSLMIRYSERGTIPYTREEFGNDVRFSVCEVTKSLCISSRARYETRTEGSRYQSLQLRMSGSEGNPIIGGLRWRGPSYPDRVSITCDLEDPDIRTACTITDISYAADPFASGLNRDRFPRGFTRNDQCEP